jgi:hypothetical protein
MNKNTNEIAKPHVEEGAVCEWACESLPDLVAEATPNKPTSGEENLPDAFACGVAATAVWEPKAESAFTGSIPFGRSGDSTDRDRQGRFRRGNRAALLVGAQSAAFWLAADTARREIRKAIIDDKGYGSETEAPRAVVIAADGLAQATLVRDSAFLRMLESGGPLSSAGRPRRAFTVWSVSGDRVERCLRLLGLQRAPARPVTIDEWLTTREEREPAAESFE